MSNLCDNCRCNSEIEVCADCDWRTKRFKIPRFATNGDVIKALFPHMKFQKSSASGVILAVDENNMMANTHYWSDWWNAPYKSESDKSTETFEKLLNSGFYERGDLQCRL